MTKNGTLSTLTKYFKRCTFLSKTPGIFIYNRNMSFFLCDFCFMVQMTTSWFYLKLKVSEHDFFVD